VKSIMSNRLTVLKTVLWAIVGVWAVVTVARFVHGLGATTNLSDAAPWGLWIGFDVMAGVALAAGAFVLAATVYIFHLEKYRSFVRPAILTAFLGYVAVAVGLLYDLGLPWHIWHPIIYWQHHSVLFEVAACVMLYLTVLALEFAPVVLEHSVFDRPLYRAILVFLKKVTLLLVIAGIILSTLHQSSLGSLFLIAPHRLHPLWYSPIIYVLFFVSAVGLGLMVVMAESLLAGYFLGHRVRAELLSGLGRAAAIVLGLYMVLRVGDLAWRGVLGSALDGSWLSILYLAELGISAAIPAVLLAIPRVRRSIGGLAVCAGLTVLGMVLYRLDVCFVAFARPAGAPYFPSWMELAVSLGIVSAAILVFIFFVENLRVYEHPVAVATGKPSYDPATLDGLMPHALSAPRRYSLALIVAAAVTVALLPQRAVLGIRPRQTPVQASRTIEGLALEREDGVGTVLRFAEGAPAAANLTPLLMIDGNRDGRLVLFDHQGHEDRLGGEDSCAECHHMNLPLDRASACHECHRDMYEPTRTFDHASHVRSTDGNAGCVQCHDDDDDVKTFETATACMDCHAETLMAGPTIKAPEDRWNDAVGYMDAMHELCIRCHERKAVEDPEGFPAVMQECRGCHDTDHPQRLDRLTPRAEREPQL
jgi:Ni/Fe-hydrogenase subunit HybB-like protein